MLPPDAAPQVRPARDAWLVFGFFLCIYLATMGGHFYSVDEEIAFRLTEQMATSGQVSVQPLEVMPRFSVGQGVDGQWYPSKGLGQSLLALPVIPAGVVLAHVIPRTWLPDRFMEPAGKEQGVPRTATDPVGFAQRLLWSGLNALLSAFICALLFDLARRFGFDARVSLAVTAMYGLASMAWIHASHSNFVEPLLSLCTLGTFYAAFRFVHGEPPRSAWLYVCGLTCGYAILTKVTALGLVPIMAGYFWMSARRQGVDAAALKRSLLTFIAINGAFVGVMAFYNWTRFGNPLETGYGLEQAGTGSGLRLSTQVLEHLMALFFSSGKGLLFYAPPALFFLLAFRRFAKQYEDECIIVGAIGAWFLLTSAGWYDWEGGLSWGPRLLLPMVALWTLPAGFLLAPPVRRVPVALLCGIGLLVTFSAVPINWMEAYNRDTKILTEVPAYHGLLPTDVWLSGDYALLSDAVAKIVYFKPSWSPVVGNLSVWGDRSWDLFWFSSPAEFTWHGGRFLLNAVGLCLMAGAGFCLTMLWRTVRVRAA